MGFVWTLIVGLIAGIVANYLVTGRATKPQGIILTALLGVAGAFVATWLGHAIGWYRAGEGAGLIGAIVGAIIVLTVWGVIARRSA